MKIKTPSINKKITALLKKYHIKTSPYRNDIYGHPGFPTKNSDFPLGINFPDGTEILFYTWDWNAMADAANSGELGEIDFDIFGVASHETVAPHDPRIPCGIGIIKSGLLKFSPVYADDSYDDEKTGMLAGELIYMAIKLPTEFNGAVLMVKSSQPMYFKSGYFQHELTELVGASIEDNELLEEYLGRDETQL